MVKSKASLEYGFYFTVAAIEKKIPEMELVITGEGKIDDQSNEGKVVGYVAALAKKYNIPCIGLCGITDLDEIGTRKLGLKKIIALQDGNTSRDEAINNAAALLKEKARKLLDFL